MIFTDIAFEQFCYSIVDIYKVNSSHMISLIDDFQSTRSCDQLIFEYKYQVSWQFYSPNS